MSLLSATNEQLVVETRFYIYQGVRLNYTTLTDEAARSKAWFLATRLLGLRVRIRQGACGCCVLSGRGLCDGLITRPEDSYGCLSVVSVVCCVLSGRGLWDGLITCTEESYGCLSVVSVLCCQVEVCATG